MLCRIPKQDYLRISGKVHQNMNLHSCKKLFYSTFRNNMIHPCILHLWQLFLAILELKWYVWLQLPCMRNIHNLFQEKESSSTQSLPSFHPKNQSSSPSAQCWVHLEALEAGFGPDARTHGVWNCRMCDRRVKMKCQSPQHLSSA